MRNMIKQRERMISFTNNNQLLPFIIHFKHIYPQHKRERGRKEAGLRLGLRLRGREPGF